MEIISSGKSLIPKFRALIDECEKISILSAWATTQNPLFEDLEENKEKFDRVVIGLKFFQTDPKFIKEFSKAKKVRFIKNDTSGVFHPKVYLFENRSNWHLFVGSSNLTKSGFGDNFEVIAYSKGEDFKSKTYQLQNRNLKIL